MRLAPPRSVTAIPRFDLPLSDLDADSLSAITSPLSAPQSVVAYGDHRLRNTVAASPAAVRPARVLALVPAHNEAASITETIHSLREQTRPPDEIVVVVNNSTDDTAEISRQLGVSVWDVGHLSGRKAGALNLALDRCLPHLDDDDLVLSMDADTVLTETVIENAVSYFVAHPKLGALSSNHLVMRHRNLLELLQAMEYEHDRVMIGRRKGRGGCMTGMAAVFSRCCASRDQGNLRNGLRPHKLDRRLETDDCPATHALADDPPAGLSCVYGPRFSGDRSYSPA